MDAEIDTQRLSIASVLLPVHNAERYLAEALDSVLRQTFSDFEVLLLDDGSTDQSRPLMESYARKDSRCHVYSWPNRGIVATLNAGLELARGAYIVRMDADDVCASDRFEKQIRFLINHPECVVVGSSVVWVDPEGMPLRIVGDLFAHEEIDAENMKGGQVLHHPAVVIRKEALEKAGRYREGFKHAEDLDLFLRLAEIGEVANVPEVLLSYRQHFGSVGHQYQELQGISVRKAVEEACARRGISAGAVTEKLTQRPGLERRWEIHRRWGWWALQAGNITTARKHALRALAFRPFSRENWRLAVCTLRGH